MNRRDVLGCFVGMAAFPSAIFGRLFRRRHRVVGRKLTVCSEIIGWDFVDCTLTPDDSGKAALRDCDFTDTYIKCTSDSRIQVTNCRTFFTKPRSHGTIGEISVG